MPPTIHAPTMHAPTTHAPPPCIPPAIFAPCHPCPLLCITLPCHACPLPRMPPCHARPLCHTPPCRACPPCEQNDKCLWKHNFSATTIADGKMRMHYGSSISFKRLCTMSFGRSFGNTSIEYEVSIPDICNIFTIQSLKSMVISILLNFYFWKANILDKTIWWK